jgi:hypothetical protein
MNPLLILLTIAALFAIARLFHFVPFGLTTLTEDTPYEEREGTVYLYKVYQASKIYEGALVMLNATGYAVKGATATGQKAAGIALEQVDNTTGASGEKTIRVKEGIFRFNNSSGGDEITIAEIGQTCYIVDDNTVAKTSGTGTRSPTGYIRDVQSDGVWVEIKNTYATDGDLVASNNLSEVTPATARANIGANLVALHIEVVTLVGSNVYRVVSPFAGIITKIYSVIDGILTVGDATLTGKIGATAITDGAITITQAGSAAGDVDVATPSALRTVAAANVISVTVGGTNATATGAKITILIAT